MSDRGRPYRHQRVAPSRWYEADTPMCRAFLAALARWVLVNHGNPAARVILPTGIVTAGELVRVLAALDRARRERAS